MVPIKYVGLKAEVTDTVAETGLKWKAGEIQYVPNWAVGKLTYHTDTWAIATEEDLAAAGMLEPDPSEPEMPKREPEIDEPDSIKVGMPNLTSLNKAALSTMAMQRYGQVLAPTMKIAEMRAQIVSWENGGYQRGH